MEIGKSSKRVEQRNPDGPTIASINPFRSTWAWAAFALEIWVTGCRPQVSLISGPLSQRGYLWQHAWNSAVVEAVQEADRRMDGTVIIGAEILWHGANPETERSNIDWPSLENASKPVALALRVAPYPGPFSKSDLVAEHIVHTAKSLLTDAAAHRIRVSEFELDFDCGQKRLSGYSLWVEAVRAVVNPARLVITALPAWLNEPTFAALVQQADGFVLQVHSVPVSAKAGSSILLDTGLARRWVKTAAGFGIPFSVALPTYRCLAGYNENGKLIGVAMDSVDLAWPPGTRTLEFSTDADDAAKLVNEWLLARPAELKELIWYRVPVTTDQRNWRWPTLAAVMAGRKPIHKVQSIQSGNNPVDLSIKNIGEADKQGAITLTVQWTGASLVAYDALPGWTVATEKDRAVFARGEGISRRIPPGGEESVGWLRFDKVVSVTSVAEESVSDRR